MKAIIFIAAFAAIMTFVSCSKSENEALNTSKPTLSVKTNFGGFTTRAAISAFPNSSAIGLFVMAGSTKINYDDVSSNNNVKAVFNGSTWTLTPAVYLSPSPATVYAYYPYSSENYDQGNIPIEHNSQTDYLYGTGNSTASSYSSEVNLTMRHALALLQFKINRRNYTGNGIITRIEVVNKAGKTNLYSAGWVNILTGDIMKTSDMHNSALLSNSSGIYTITSTPTSVENPNLRLLVIPNTTTVLSGDIQIIFTIDGRSYSYNVPAATTWKSGTKNTYTVTLSGTGLTIGNVIITDWTSGVSGTVTLN